MKEREILKKLKEYGWTFSEGANHTMAHSPDGKKKVPIPRHGSKEINPVTLKKIEKQTAVIFNSK